MTVLAGLPIGTLAGWATFAAVLAAAWIIYKGGGGMAISTLQSANQVLADEANRLGKANLEQARTIAHLQSRTDVAAALEPLMSWTVEHGEAVLARHEKMFELLDNHEARTRERAEAELRILNMIAERLGPEPNGADT